MCTLMHAYTHSHILIHPHPHTEKQVFSERKTDTSLLPIVALSMSPPHSAIFCNTSGLGIGVDA